jgi:hypothetical protein
VGLACAATLHAAACGSFGTSEPDPSGGDGGADGAIQPAVTRDLRVAVDWPRVASLDPSGDVRASKIRVTVTDATDAGRKTERAVARTDRGPYDFPGFTTSSRVDVVVEITGGDGRLLGYGEARGWDLARATTIDVAARKRFVYFLNADREPEELRVLDLAPADRGEPAIAEGPAPLATLASATALDVTSDGRLLVEAAAPNGAGAIAVFETSTHERTRTIDLPFPPDVFVPVGDGHKLLAFPGAKASSAQLARVDVDTGAVDDLASGFQGGKLVVYSAARSPDGARIVAAGTYQASPPNGPVKPYLLTVDTATSTTTAIDVPDVLVASAVRFTADGTRLLVAGYTRPAGDDVSTGTLFFYDASPTTPSSKLVMAADTTRPVSLVLHPNRGRAYVTMDMLYPSSGGGCCGGLDVVDLASGALGATYGMTASGPEYGIACALRLPYAPYRVLAGQSDPGNNVHAPFLELSPDADRPVDLDVSAGGIGTVRAMAAPFARRL